MSMLGKEQTVFIAQSRGKTGEIRRSPGDASIKSRNQTCWTLRIPRQDAFTRVTLFNGRVKSRVFPIRALVTQRAAAAARHPDHHYDRSEDVTVQKHGIFDGQSMHTTAIL